ncbi:MAG: Uma2 family endonuclease [Bryobacteraceae bacterium]
MTVEEFRQLPEDRGAFYHELRHGEAVPVARPKLKQALIRSKLRELLEKVAEPESFTEIMVGFRPLPEHELWVADVVYLSAERFRSADPEDNIRGAPDLVVEVLSPSNTAAEMLDKEQICLANGAREFWVVDPNRRHVKVTNSEGRTKLYHCGEEIPLPLFGNASLAVDTIFV